MKRRSFLKNSAILGAVAVFGCANLSPNLLFGAENLANSQNSNKGKNMKILLLGATGSLGSFVIDELLKNEKTELILYVRNPAKAKQYENERVKIIEGDANDTPNLIAALQGVDAVYAGLAGDLENLANSVVSAMKKAGVKRIVWITSYGIYGEAARGGTPPISYVNSAKIIENSGLDYTLIRPQWFSFADEINYEVTHRHEKFKNPDAQISRKSIAHLVGRCIYENFGIKDSLGINRP